MEQEEDLHPQNTYTCIGDINFINDFIALMNNKPLKSELDQFVIRKVRDKRIEAKLSQKHLANELNVAIGFIGHVESPKNRAKYNLSYLIGSLEKMKL